MVVEEKYELTNFISEGAMGWVYRATHKSLESSIAVKLMKPASEPDETRDKRFEREARAASALNNPHIISIVDFGRTPGGMLFIVSEYLRGKTLADIIIKEGAIPLPRALRIIDQILSAAYEAHGAGLIHRDLKPENVIITPLRSGEDFVKVLDFGIAKLGGDQHQRLTMQGQLFGTPAYMAPEQIRGQEVTPRTDLYACSLILYEMLAGHEPFRSESVMEVLSMQLHDEPPPLREAEAAKDLPAELEAVVMRGLSKDPADRFATAAELREALNSIKSGRAVSTILCSSCGNPMAINSKFCPECGLRKSQFRIPVVDTDGQPVSPVSSEQPRAPSPSREATAATVHATSERALNVHTTLERNLKADRTVKFELVGRAGEIEELSDLLTGDRRSAEILGESGSGRSSMLTVAGQLAERLGLRVLRAGPDPVLTRTPWYPVHSLVQQLFNLSGAPPDLQTLQHRIIDVGLLPEDLPGLAELFGIPHMTGRVEYAVRRREVSAAATRALLFTPHSQQGLCLLLDDADEFDGASRSLVQHLCTTDSIVPVYVIMTAEKSILADIRADLTLKLQPLELQDIESLMHSALDRSTDSWPDLVESLAETSHGNPFHITQAIRLLAEGGSEIDAGLGDILVTRIGRLPKDSLRLLQIVCVIGSHAPTEKVRELYADDKLFPGALRLLGRRGFLNQDPQAVLEVCHPLIAEGVREAMPADARHKLHLRVLAQLEEDGAGAIALVRHAVEAQQAERALVLLQRAGEQAESWLDDAGAAYHYRQALHVARWKLLYEEDREECLNLSLQLADTLRFSGDADGARLVIKEALAVSERHPFVHARLLRTLSRVYTDGGDELSAVQTMHQAVRTAIFAGDPGLLNEMYIELGKMLTTTGHWSEASEELSEGVLMVTSGDGAESTGAPSSFWRLLTQLAEIQFQQDSVEHAVDTAYAALRQAERESSLIGQARCHYLLAKFLDRMDREGPAEDHHSAALAAFRRLGDRRSAAECLIARASRSPSEYIHLLQEALALAKQIDWYEGIQAATALLGKG
ncbi:MAG: protein kinase [bacterium]